MLSNFLKSKSVQPAVPRNGAPPVQDSIEEAAQQHLGKESKLDVAAQAVMIEDLRALAREDRKNVRDYRMKHKAALGTSESAAEDGDLIVADNITVKQLASHPISGLAKGAMLATALLGGGAGAGLGVAALTGAFQKQQPPAIEKQVWRGKLRVGWGEDGEPKVDVLDQDGKPVGQ